MIFKPSRHERRKTVFYGGERFQGLAQTFSRYIILLGFLVPLNTGSVAEMKKDTSKHNSHRSFDEASEFEISTHADHISAYYNDPSAINDGDSEDDGLDDFDDDDFDDDFDADFEELPDDEDDDLFDDDETESEDDDEDENYDEDFDDLNSDENTFDDEDDE